MTIISAYSSLVTARSFFNLLRPRLSPVTSRICFLPRHPTINAIVGALRGRNLYSLASSEKKITYQWTKIIQHKEIHPLYDSRLHEILADSSENKIKTLAQAWSNRQISKTDMNRINSQRHSPLYSALKYECNAKWRYEIVSWLLDHGAIINNNEFEHGSCAHNIIFYNDSPIGKLWALRAILERDPTIVKCKNKNQESLLDYALSYESDRICLNEILRLLLKNKIVVTGKNIADAMPLVNKDVMKSLVRSAEDD